MARQTRNITARAVSAATRSGLHSDVIRANKFQVKIHAISCQVPLRVVFDADVIDTELAMHNIFAVRVAS